MQILSNPEMISLELFITMYALAVLLGFLLIRMYKNESIARFFDRVGLDLYGHEDTWYRLFHKADYVTVYLKDGNIVSGWPTYFSQSGNKQTSELYLTKIHYYQKDKERWVKPSKSTEGLLINTDSISHIEFRRPETAMEPEATTEPETRRRQTFKNRCKKLLEWVAKYYIWVFGIMLAHLAVIGEIIALPGEALKLIILLYIFDAAWIFVLCSEIYRNLRGKQ